MVCKALHHRHVALERAMSKGLGVGVAFVLTTSEVMNSGSFFLLHFQRGCYKSLLILAHP